MDLPVALRRFGEVELRRFLGDRWAAISATQVAVGLMLVLMVLFVAAFAFFVSLGARQTQQRFEDRAAAAAQVMATNAYWITEVANQTLRRVDIALGPNMAGDESVLRTATEDLPSIVEVYIIDSAANTVYSTVPGANAVSVSDREYFTALRDGEQFYNSPMIVSRLTGDRIFVFSKRVERNGEFAGAIMVSYSDRLLETLWRSLNLEPGSTVSFVRDDGQLMARFPAADGPVDLSSSALFTQHLPAGDTGTYTSASSPVDGIARVVGYTRVAGTRMIALASIASTETWSTFRNGIAAVMFIVSPIVLGLGLGCWWIVLLLNRDTRQREELTLLFREIHHRIKNNMQSVQALVGLQDIPEAAKQDLRSRFAAMAAMHEHIYKHDLYASIDAKDFIPSIVDEVLTAYGSSVKVRYEVSSLSIGKDQATPLALLLSELVTNALKYAFPARTDGTVTVSLVGLPDGRASLTVRDDGVGMSETSKGRSMGMRLVKGVVAQLHGEHSFRNEGGTVFEAALRLADD